MTRVDDEHKRLNEAVNENLRAVSMMLCNCVRLNTPNVETAAGRRRRFRPKNTKDVSDVFD